MSFLPESELVNLKYQLAQQIKANINRAASGKRSNTPFLDSFMDTLIDEMAELKIEVSKLSLALSSLKKAEQNHTASATSIINKDEVEPSSDNNIWTFPIKINPEYLQNIENFHYPEENENGNYYIWMGSGNKTSIEFPIDLISPIKLILKNVRFITDDIRESFKLFINGEELKFESFKQDHGYNIAASWLPSPNSIKDKCTIDIYVDRSVSVQELYPETNDTRKLCLALSEIEILNNTQEYVNT